MTNIWGFLVQTISVSLVALLLLVVKKLLSDKLSPRWQYGVWGMLSLRILLPVSMTRPVLFPIPLWIETWKGVTERTLHSAHSAVYTPISVRWPIPIITARPQSITDWLFTVYTAGVILLLLWYFLSYLRLRQILHHATPVSAAVQARIQSICDIWALPSCRAVTAPGLPSAFVCGVLRPVLVLPADTETDDKVLLHELLHLKHRDALQCAIWCIFRALNWCNPFLQYVMNCIGNDMESLCDQRVLERLTGEARREYGGILLSMANKRYPRAPGTTSISNGGKNITRRITAIVRFKKYPKGMGLVSICICFVLALPLLAGSAADYQINDYLPDKGMEFERAMALTRIQRCTTVAGALDTYAKGLMYENGIYITMTSSQSRHAELDAQMRYNAKKDNLAAYHLSAGDTLQYISRDAGYCIYNLEKQDDGSYTALLVFSVDVFLNPDQAGWMHDENGNPYNGSVLLSVSLRQEDGWIVTETAERELFPGVTISALQYEDRFLDFLRQTQQKGACGTVNVSVNTCYTVANDESNNGWSSAAGTVLNQSIMPDAGFGRAENQVYIQYTFSGTTAQRSALSRVEMAVIPLDSIGDTPLFSDETHTGNTSWSNSDGSCGCSRAVTADWDGVLTDCSINTMMINDNEVVLPTGYAVRIYWNGAPVEDFILKGAN